GSTGRWSDLAAMAGKALVSGYEDHYGDLLVGTADGTGGLSYQIVDGVPNVPPTLDPTGYRAGIADPRMNVGLYTSLKLDAMGRGGRGRHLVLRGAQRRAKAGGAQGCA